MAPDFRGRTTGPWEPWLHALPVEFAVGASRFTTSSAPSPGSTSSRRSTGPRRVGGCTGTPERLDRDRRRVGHPGLLAASGAGAGARAADRGGQLRHAARADAQNGGNRLPDNVSGRARRRSSGPRRCAADLPRGGRGVSSDARSATPELGQNGCCSKRVRMASTSCPHAEGVAVVLEEPARHGTGHPELVDAQSQGTRAMCGPAERRCHRERGRSGCRKVSAVVMAVISASKDPANSGRKRHLAIKYCHGNQERIDAGAGRSSGFRVRRHLRGLRHRPLRRRGAELRLQGLRAGGGQAAADLRRRVDHP